MNRPLGELGRFAEPSLYILVSLSAGPKHGYAIMTDVEEISGSPIGPGTLYGALARLERRGLIEALEPEDRRRPYRLTALGATTSQAQLEQPRRLRPDRPGAARREDVDERASSASIRLPGGSATRRSSSPCSRRGRRRSATGSTSSAARSTRGSIPRSGGAAQDPITDERSPLCVARLGIAAVLGSDRLGCSLRRRADGPRSL